MANSRFQGDSLLVADVPEARILASPDLKFVLDGRRMNVSGSVEIPEAQNCARRHRNGGARIDGRTDHQAGSATRRRRTVRSDDRFAPDARQERADKRLWPQRHSHRRRAYAHSPARSVDCERRTRSDRRRVPCLRQGAGSRTWKTAVHRRPGHGSGRGPSRHARIAGLQGRRNRAGAGSAGRSSRSSPSPACRSSRLRRC